MHLGRHALIAIGAGVALAIFMFSVPGHGSMDAVNVGLATLLGATFGIAFYWGISRRAG